MLGVISLINHFSGKPRHLKGIRVLQTVIGLVLIIRISTELPFANYLWGPNGIGLYNSSTGYFGLIIGRKLDVIFFGSMVGVYVILFLLGLCAIGLIMNYKTRLCALFAFFLFVLWEARLPSINDGGDNIMRLTSFYMIFLSSSPQNLKRGGLKT